MNRALVLLDLVLLMLVGFINCCLGFFVLSFRFSYIRFASTSLIFRKSSFNTNQVICWADSL